MPALLRQAVAPLLLVCALAASAQSPDPHKPTPRAPLQDSEVALLPNAGVSSERLQQLVRRHGYDFEPSPAMLRILTAAGADGALLETLRKTRPILPSASPSALPKSVFEPDLVTVRMGSQRFLIAKKEV